MTRSTSIVFRVHAIRRMYERRISADDVREVLASGETIEDYPDDLPYRSRLLLGFVESRPIHVVAADNVAGSETIIVTAYEPDLTQWEVGFRRRKV